MVNYYKRLMNNTGRSQAIRQTQLEMLSHPTYQHPFYWAAFIPSGDWTAMGN
jgi:CHAT domain-containing protein